MSLTIVLAMMFAAGSTPKCEVILLNSSAVDLSMTVEGKETQIAPGESRHIPATSLTLIAFGAVNHTFSLSQALQTLCAEGKTTEIEARVDGQLWLHGVSSQPAGLPLKPVEMRDLTQAPPNNSFKPRPLRGSA